MLRRYACYQRKQNDVIIYDYAISREFYKVRLDSFLKEHPDIEIRYVILKKTANIVKICKGKQQ